MNFIEYMRTSWDHVLELAIGHVVVTAVSVAITAVLGIGLGVATYRTERPRELALAVAATFLTLPSFALFGLFLVWIGLGAAAVIPALVMYGLLPVLRNTIVGLREVDPAVVESARGMGMGKARLLLRIELPLAWPVILTGIRVATLLLLGIAAIGAYVLGPGLGQDIFDGISAFGTDRALNLILGGTLGIVVLAILFDLLYALITRITTSQGIR